MTNERYVFNQTITERNAMKRGSYARKVGSKSRKCTLPSDRMTTAEWKRRNGKVITYKLNAPMTYAQLKQLDPQQQYEYLSHLISAYGARNRDIADMLGVSSNTVTTLSNKLPARLKFGHVINMDPRWLDFITTPEEPSTGEPEPSDVPQSEDNPEQPTADSSDNTAPTNGELFFTCKPGEAFRTVFSLLDADKTYNIRIGFFENKSEPTR